MESDRFICAREDSAAKKEVVIVDLSDANNIIRRPISAESAIMHPTEKIIALRGVLALKRHRDDSANGNMSSSSETASDLQYVRVCKGECGIANIYLCRNYSEAKQKVKSHLMHEVSIKRFQILLHGHLMLYVLKGHIILEMDQYDNTWNCDRFCCLPLDVIWRECSHKSFRPTRQSLWASDNQLPRVTR